GIAQEAAFDRMPILADALEDAGCDNSIILDHCRHAENHEPACWVLALILSATPPPIFSPPLATPAFVEAGRNFVEPRSAAADFWGCVIVCMIILLGIGFGIWLSESTRLGVNPVYLSPILVAFGVVLFCMILLYCHLLAVLRSRRGSRVAHRNAHLSRETRAPGEVGTPPG